MAGREGRSMNHSTRHGGAFGIVVFVLAAAALATFVLFGANIRESLGLVERPEEIGAVPIESRLTSPELFAETRGSDLESVARPVVKKESAQQERTIEDKQPQTRAIEEPVNQDAKATALLAEAKDHYRNFEWDKVANLSSRITTLTASGQLEFEARDLARRAKNLRTFMNKLDSIEGGMARNDATSPHSVIVYTQAGTTFQAVPLTRSGNEIPAASDAVAYVESAKGSVKLRMNGRSTADYPSNKIMKVEAADLKSIRAKCMNQLDDNLQRIQRDKDLQNDALALFAAASFAYQNRLDERVTELLDKALALDPQLSITVREDKATNLYDKVVSNMKKGNKTSANGFMAKLRTQYSDTSIFAQADAFYNNDAKKALKLARKAEEEKKAAIRKEREERLALARQTKAKEVVEKIIAEEKAEEKAVEEERIEEERTFATVSGAEGDADTLNKKGEILLKEAFNMPATGARDAKYSRARKYFLDALKIYNKLYAKDESNERLGSKIISASRNQYTCMKYKRLH